MTFVVVQCLNGLAYGLLLFLMAAGLSLIFGMMDVVNLAHGALYMLGAYLALTVVQAGGSFWLAMAAAPLLVAALGLIAERTLLRSLYGRHLDQVLRPFGLAFVTGDMARAVWGAEVRAIAAPPQLNGSLPIGDYTFPIYKLFVIALGLALAAALWLLVERTRVGAILRAGVSDREMAEALGINVGRVFNRLFAAVAGLAALSGVVAAPISSLYPGMDLAILLTTLIVVVVGGLGSLRGAFWGAILIGQAETFGIVLLPDFALALIFLIMAAVLLWRPRGLFGRSE